MSIYCFLGTYSEIGIEGSVVKLSEFGQRVELSDDLAASAIGTHLTGGAALLPAALFDGIFTEQELSLYSNPLSHAQANEAFHDKKQRALIASHDLRTHVGQGENIPSFRAPEVSKEVATEIVTRKIDLDELPRAEPTTYDDQPNSL